MRAALLLSDVAVVAAAVLVAQMLRFGQIDVDVAMPAGGYSYVIVSAVLIGTWTIALGVSGSRSAEAMGNGFEESRRVFVATFWVFGVIAVVATLLQLDIARGYLAIAFPAGLLGLLCSRLMARRHLQRSRAQGMFTKNVLAVGDLRSVRTLATSFADHPGDGFRLVGACGPGVREGALATVSDAQILAASRCGDIPSAVLDCEADTVVLASGHLRPEEIRDLSWELEKLDVELILAPGMVDVAVPRLRVRVAAGQPLIHVEKPRYSSAKRFQKRLFDVCFAGLFLVAVSPVMLVAAACVKLTTRGPVFYLSERVGLDGRSFRMVKFRTMVVDADRQLDKLAHLNESDGGVLFKIRDDPRVTPVGRFLRRYSIDELPQFFNVLGGSMSVVGPRPPLPREADKYDLRTRRRLLVRPGITGLWQVSGRSDLSWEESVRLDLSYVENWSMFGDLVIAMTTAKVVMTHSGAY